MNIYTAYWWVAGSTVRCHKAYLPTLEVIGYCVLASQINIVKRQEAFKKRNMCTIHEHLVFLSYTGCNIKYLNATHVYNNILLIYLLNYF